MSTQSDAVSALKNAKTTAEDASTTDRLARAAHAVIDDTAEKAQGVEQDLRQRAARAGEKLETSQEAASAHIERTLAKAESFARGRPVAAAGIAFAAGVLATALLRR